MVRPRERGNTMTFYTHDLFTSPTQFPRSTHRIAGMTYRRDWLQSFQWLSFAWYIYIYILRNDIVKVCIFIIVYKYVILNLWYLIYLSSRFPILYNGWASAFFRVFHTTQYTYLYCAAITGTKKINCKILSGDFIFGNKRQISMVNETHPVSIFCRIWNFLCMMQNILTNQFYKSISKYHTFSQDFFLFYRSKTRVVYVLQQCFLCIIIYYDVCITSYFILEFKRMYLLLSLKYCELDYKCRLQPVGSINFYNINKVVQSLPLHESL